MSATGVLPDQASSPVPAAGGSGLWRRYSARYELLLSTLGSWAIHICVILAVLFASKTFTAREVSPPKVDVVAANAGPSAGAPGQGEDGRARGPRADQLGAPQAVGGATTSAAASYASDSLPAAVTDALPKLPDLDLSGVGISSPLLGAAGGMLAVPDGAGGKGGGGGNAASGLGAGFASTEFFGTQVWGSKFVYVIDRSGSMSERDALGAAKRELLASLGNLPPDAQFQIIFYNLRVDVMPIGGSARKLVHATDANKAHAHRLLDSFFADGGTEHLPALKTALALGPDVIFFLTDADDLRPRDAKDATELNKGRAKIHAIEFGVGPEVERQNTLRDLATANGGTYRYIDTSKLAGAAASGSR